MTTCKQQEETGPPMMYSIVELGKSLLIASRDGNMEEVRQLLNMGAPFTTDWLGTSPLHLSSQNGHLDCALLLLSAGMSIESRTKVERTATHFAASNGYANVLEAMIKCGSDINNTDLVGMTPLHWAVEKEHAGCVELLLKYGADWTIENKFLLTPLDLARLKNFTDIYEMLQFADEYRDETVISTLPKSMSAVCVPQQQQPQNHAPDVTPHMMSGPSQFTPVPNSGAGVHLARGSTALQSIGLSGIFSNGNNISPSPTINVSPVTRKFSLSTPCRLMSSNAGCSKQLSQNNSSSNTFAVARRTNLSLATSFGAPPLRAAGSHLPSNFPVNHSQQLAPQSQFGGGSRHNFHHGHQHIRSPVAAIAPVPISVATPNLTRHHPCSGPAQVLPIRIVAPCISSDGKRFVSNNVNNGCVVAGHNGANQSGMRSIAQVKAQPVAPLLVTAQAQEQERQQNNVPLPGQSPTTPNSVESAQTTGDKLLNILECQKGDSRGISSGRIDKSGNTASDVETAVVDDGEMLHLLRTAEAEAEAALSKARQFRLQADAIKRKLGHNSTANGDAGDSGQNEQKCSV